MCSEPSGPSDATLPLANVRTLNEIYSKSLARTSFTLVMLAMAGVMALSIGLVGVYGVDLLLGLAAEARTRHSRCARRSPRGVGASVCRPRLCTRSNRRSLWIGRGSRFDACARFAVIRGKPARSADLRNGFSRLARCLRHGELSPDVTRDEYRPDGGSTHGIELPKFR